jgi:octopine/nopaline transport system substrate-binding protein
MITKLFKKSILAAVTIIILVFGTLLAAQEYKDITIATEGAYAPFNFKDAGGNLVGFEVDLAADLCKRMAIKCTLVEQAWDGMIPSLIAGKYDVIMAGMTIKAKREKVISFSRNYVGTPSTFIVLKTSSLANFDTELDIMILDKVSADEEATLKKMRKAFAGKTIGVQISTTQEDFINEMMPKIKVKSYGKIDNMLLDIISGRVDIGLTSVTFLTPLMKKPEGEKIKMIGPSLTKGPFGRGAGAGIRKEDKQLRNMFSKAINETIADGSLRKLAIKWFEFDTSPAE